MMKRIAGVTAGIAMLVGVVSADNERRHDSIPRLDHVFVIVMENHGFQQIIDNPNEPYLNRLIKKGKVNLATNYFAIGHPSLTNYLEIVGGSNFGIRSDNDPAWHDPHCQPNLLTGIVNADNNSKQTAIPVDTGNICPIDGVGQDADTPAVDNWNEVEPEFPFLADIDGLKSVPASKHIVGRTIADQLVEAGLTWKSYQESLPLSGADGVNYSNGTASNLTDFTNLAPLTSDSVLKAYAAKHNPFVYFRTVQEGWPWTNGLQNVVGFDGRRGLFEDLATGNVPSLAFIAPNQCNDQHGRGNGDAFCGFDFGDASGLTAGTQVGLNPGLIQQGDVTLERLVTSIKASPVWREGRTAIVIVWDENDYSGISTTPNGFFPPQNQNKVVLTVEMNRDFDGGVKSNTYYNSFSLLRSLEEAFGLPCLNHACDRGVSTMSDLFER
jgi:hypothetical protein